MKYLNVGCGSHYSTLPEWTNLDFVSTGRDVIAHNLLNGIPFESETFDLVYHSHVLEHFSKEDGEKFIKECFRVLKSGGIIRIAVPDLERIAQNYLNCLERGLQDPNNEMIRADYDWMLLEMYDQAVRNFSGGNMAKYLYTDTIRNEAFVFERLGEEAKSIRRKYLEPTANNKFNNKIAPVKTKLLVALKANLKSYLIKKLKINEDALAIGKFRLEGEIHQWMYDRYSLSLLLQQAGGIDIKLRDAFTSFINNWAGYNIDGKEEQVRKPDSLFMEAIKKNA